MLAWFGAFFSILNDLNGLEGGRGRQPGGRGRQTGGRERQFGCEGHHRCEKVKTLKSTLTRNVDWPNFRTVKMVQLFTNFQWAELPKSWLSVARPEQIYRLSEGDHFRNKKKFQICYCWLLKNFNNSEVDDFKSELETNLNR